MRIKSHFFLFLMITGLFCLESIPIKNVLGYESDEIWSRYKIYVNGTTDEIVSYDMFFYVEYPNITDNRDIHLDNFDVSVIGFKEEGTGNTIGNLDMRILKYHEGIYEDIDTITGGWIAISQAAQQTTLDHWNEFCVYVFEDLDGNTFIHSYLHGSYMNFNFTFTPDTGYSMQDCILWVNISSTFYYTPYESIITTLINRVTSLLPLFVVIFMIPLALYSQYGKNGFLIGLFISTTIAFISQLISLSIYVVMIISEITLVFINYKKREIEIEV